MGIFIKFCRHTQIVITVGRREEAHYTNTYICNKLGYLHYHGYTSYQFFSCCCGYLYYYCHVHYKVYQDSLWLLWNSVTIVTWLIKLPMYLMASTVPFAVMVIVITVVTFLTLGCFGYAHAFEVLRSEEVSYLVFVLIPRFRYFYHEWSTTQRTAMREAD